MSQTFIDFLKRRLDVFNTLKIVFGIPETDPANEPFIFMGLSLGKQGTLLCVLVPQSLRHYIKTSLQSNEVTAELRRIHINGIYFSRVSKKAKNEQVTRSQLSISSACESMTSNDFGELYDSAYEDIQRSESLSSLQELIPNPKKLKHQVVDEVKPDENWMMMSGVHNNNDSGRHGNSVKIDSKPQLVRISSDYVIDKSITLKIPSQTSNEDESTKHYSRNDCPHHANVNPNPQFVQISSKFVGQEPSNSIAKLDVKPSYGKRFLIEYQPKSSKSPRVKPSSFPGPNHSDERDVTKDTLFSQRSEISEISFEEPPVLERERHKECYHGNDQNGYWYDEVPVDEPVSSSQYSEKKDYDKTVISEERRHYEKENNHYVNYYPYNNPDYHGNDKNDSSNQRTYAINGHNRIDDEYLEDSKPYYQMDLLDQRNESHDDKQYRDNDRHVMYDGYQSNMVYNYRNQVMLPEPEPEPGRRSGEHPSSLIGSFSDGFEPIRRSTPNSSVSGFSTHELSYKSRGGNISRSMPTLYPIESGKGSAEGRELLREFKPKYESQADLEDHVFIDTHPNNTTFGSLPSDYYCAPPNYQEAIIKKSFLSLRSVDVDMRCKKVKSPLLSTQSVSSIYREKEQLLSKLELQESIRSAEIKEWEKLLDKSKDFLKAAKLGDEEEVQNLLNEGVDADYMNEFGHTALMIACREGHLQVVHVLLTYSADLNTQDKFGKSALHEAAWSGKHQVIQPLVTKGADINAIDEEGRTPLQFAAIRGQTKVAEVLLLLGADASILNKDGESAVELAFKRRHNEIVNLLLNSIDKEARKTMQSQIRKLKIQRLKSATSNLYTKRNKSKALRPSGRRPQMFQEPSFATL